MRILIIAFLVLLLGQAGAVDKRLYDHPGSLHPSVQEGRALAKSTPAGAQAIRGEALEISMLPGGYFTIGTHKGYEQTAIDDQCNVTFGHPYAMTSYPVFSIDGEWFRLDERVADLQSLMPVGEGDSLLIRAAVSEALTIEFMMHMELQGVRFLFELENSDTVAHDFGAALFIDPALGRNGDGFFFIEGEQVEEDMLISPVSQQEIRIWEKSHYSRGMGMALSWGEILPDGLIVANWNDLRQRNEPVFTPSILRKLYDLDLQVFWEESTLQPGNRMQFQMLSEILEPDVRHPAFLRWDIPGFLTMEDGTMFPRDLSTRLEVWNMQNDALSDLNLEADSSWIFSLNVPGYNFHLEKDQITFPRIGLSSRIVYEDRIEPLSLSLVYEGEVIDRLQRNVFVPATPVSDTGLVIVDDSISVSAYPNVDVLFAVEIEESGRRVLDLGWEHIWLYENGSRIHDFSLKKYEDSVGSMADVVFVLDCSGSMGDEIDAVKDNLGEFADSLQANGYDYQIGVVTFSTNIDAVWDLTDDVEAVKANLESVDLWGGVENSPLALYTASELSFREGSKRTIIWITDEPYPEDSYTKTEIVNRMLEMGITVHGVGTTSLQTEWFNPIVQPTGGNFYDINGNFRDILLDVTRTKAADRYQVQFTSDNSDGLQNEVKVVVHYAGKGGEKCFFYEPPAKVAETASLVCYPNPFNPVIQFKIAGPGAVRNAELHIYNMLGQRVRTFDLGRDPGRLITWNARNQSGEKISSGFYIVQLNLTDQAGSRIQKQQKILYLK